MVLISYYVSVGLMWPLTGRAEELGLIAGVLRHANRSQGVVLAGAAGVGKTRLAREALAAAKRRGAPTHWIAATASARGIPLGAFAALVGPVGGDPASMLRQAAEELVGAARPTGPHQSAMLVGVDDAHLLDDQSGLLVQHLVLREMARLVVTVRTGEPVSDAISGLWKNGHLDEMVLQALTESQTLILLEAVVGGPVDQLACRRMWAVTRGNALFLRHLVDAEAEAGRFRQVSGVWLWSPAPTLPPALTEFVEARLGQLPSSQRTVVELLALGEPLGVSLLGRLTSPAAVEQVETGGLVVVERDGRRWQARLAHPLYGEVRRGSIGQLRARRLRGEIAMALAGTGCRRSDDVLRRAFLAHESDLVPDPALLIEGARRAAQLCDLPLAERLAKAAVGAGGGFPAQLVVTSAITGQARYADGAVELAVLRNLATTEDERIRATVHQVLNLGWMSARPDDALAALAEAEGEVGEGIGRLRLTALRANLEAILAQPLSAMTHARTALAWPDLPDESIVLACNGLVLALATSGHASEIGPIAEKGFQAAARSAELAYFRLAISGMKLLGLRLAGHLREAAEVAVQCRQVFKDIAFAAEVSGLLMGEMELAQGRVASSLRWLREARAGLTVYGHAGGWMYYCLIALTRALALSGEVAQAQRALADVRAHRHPGMLAVEPERLLAQAWVTAARGEVRNAGALARKAAVLAAETDQWAHEVLALHTAVRFGDRATADRLTELAGHVEGPYAAAAAAHATALAANNAGALHQASEMLEQLGDLLAAADAEAQAAAIYAKEGRRAAANGAAARCHALAGSCEGAHTPALIAAAKPLPLTGREREVFTLAAEGLSNKDIAARLTVSVRTVEGHLYRINAKLGTTSRAELPAIRQPKNE